MMVIALKSRAHREKERERGGGRWVGNMVEFERSSRRMMQLSQQDFAPYEKGLSGEGGDWAREVWEYWQCFDRTSAVSPALVCRGYTGTQRSPTLYTRCHRDLSPYSRHNQSYPLTKKNWRKYKRSKWVMKGVNKKEIDNRIINKLDWQLCSPRYDFWVEK